MRASATARTRRSSEKGRRSSTAPPPRAMTMTSTPSMASSSVSARPTSGTQWSPCTATSRISKRAAGHRSDALTTTSSSALAPRPQIRPIVRGRNGRGFLRLSENRPSAARRARSASIWASRSPTPCRCISAAWRFRRPERSQNTGFTRVTTRAPSVSGVESMTPAHAVTVIDVSVWRSRSVKKCIFAPGRTLYSTTWPSTHRGLMRSTYTLMFSVSRRSGHGLSRVVSAAFAAGGRGWGEPPGGGAARR